jgi:hypothetical protein
MIEKALKYIISMKKPEILEIAGHTYSDKDLERISYNPKASTIEMCTLSSLIDYIKAKIDVMSDHMIIHVKSPTCVQMYSKLDHERKREYMVEVNAQVPEFDFNRFIDHEKFCINLQSKIIDDETTDKALLLKFAGTVEAGSVAEYGDDGVTQKATVKTGIASKGDAVVPSPVTLIPFRTFVEVEQPTSKFIFRLQQDKYDGIQCALFEADGGAWKIDAMKSIKSYLEKQLEGIEVISIIS